MPTLYCPVVRRAIAERRGSSRHTGGARAFAASGGFGGDRHHHDGTRTSPCAGGARSWRRTCSKAGPWHGRSRNESSTLTCGVVSFVVRLVPRDRCCRMPIRVGLLSGLSLPASPDLRQPVGRPASTAPRHLAHSAPQHSPRPDAYRSAGRNAELPAHLSLRQHRPMRVANCVPVSVRRGSRRDMPGNNWSEGSEPRWGV